MSLVEINNQGQGKTIEDNVSLKLCFFFLFVTKIKQEINRDYIGQGYLAPSEHCHMEKIKLVAAYSIDRCIKLKSK